MTAAPILGYDRTFPDGTRVVCDQIVAEEDGPEVRFVLYAPLEIISARGAARRVTPFDSVWVGLDAEDRLVVRPAPDFVPGLSKEAGIEMAYTFQVPDRVNFERLAHYVCQTCEPGTVISTNEVWAMWRHLGWPEPQKRTFAGNVFPTLAKRGWVRFESRDVPNTSGNGHSTEPNCGWVSQICTPEFVPVPRYEGQTNEQRIEAHAARLTG